jgi:nucleoside phosphorylase
MESEAIMKHLADQLKRRKMPRLWPYHLLLTRHDNAHMTLAGYRLLATLLREGYFSTVVTVNPEPLLEEMLEFVGIKRSAYRVLVVGQDEDTRVADVLQGLPSGISIVKVHADISSKGPTVPPVLSREVLISLQYYLCRDIVIVGSLEHDPLLTSILYEMSALSPVDITGSIYYAMSEQQGATDPVLTIKTLIDQLRTPFIISGNDGTFEGFFSRLATILQVASEPQLIAAGPFQLPAAQCSGEVVPANATVHINPGKESVAADILLVTVTYTEADAVLAYAPHAYTSMPIGKRTYYDLGTIGANRTFMVRTTSQGALEAFSTVKDGIEALTPRAVIMVGIAFGYDKGQQQIGDIMVATQIRDYDLKRVGSTATQEQIVHPRGPRVPTSQPLLDRFINSPHTIYASWPDAPAIHSGLLLSGSSLVDHKEYRDQLRQAAPDAIGGEMEGAGLLKAAMEAEYKVDWILIKAISDWADGTKNADDIEKQRKAAGNAARFTFHVIQQPGFLSRK